MIWNCLEGDVVIKVLSQVGNITSQCILNQFFEEVKKKKKERRRELNQKRSAGCGFHFGGIHDTYG